MGRDGERREEHAADASGAVSIRPEPVASEDSRACVNAYLAELSDRFPHGFDPGASVSASDGELGPPAGVFLLVRVEGKAVGCGGVKTVGQALGEIKRMWLDPRVRGRGLGRRLLAALEDAARALGHRAVRLDTSAHLPEAIALYRGAGYHEIPDYNGNAYAAHWFEKSLAGAG